MNNLDMANALLGSKRVNPGQTTTAYGVATSPSVNGLVMVDMGGDTVSPDDDQSIECETTFKVFEGDEVIVSLVGADGTGKTPTVMGVVGRGDQMQSAIDNVKNYFWTNDRGAHISTREQSVAGNNVLIDADSLDVRYGETNSENDQILLARFGRNTAYIGGIDGTPYWTIIDLRDAETGLTTVEDVKFGNNIDSTFITDFVAQSVISVIVNNVEMVEGEDYTFDPLSSSIIFSEKPGMSIPIVITYLSSDGIFSYSEGIRKGGSHGPYSKTTGLLNLATGSYAQAHGYSTTAAGWGSISEGYKTVANSRLQRVFGQNNVADNSNKYVEIVGNGDIPLLTREESFITPGTNKAVYTLEEKPYNIQYASLTGSDSNFFTLVTGSCESITDDNFQLKVEYGNTPIGTYTLLLEYSIKYLVGTPSSHTTKTASGSATLTRTVSSRTKQTMYYPIEIPAPSSGSNYNGEVTSVALTFLSVSDFSDQITIRTNTNQIVVPDWMRTASEMLFTIGYIYGVADKQNAFNLDWNGNAEYKGEVYLGGCTPNGETPYPAVRFNTMAGQSGSTRIRFREEYFDGTYWRPLTHYFKPQTYDDFGYDPNGDTSGILITRPLIGNGHITDSGKNICLQFVMPCDMSLITNIKLEALYGGMRGIKGYLNSTAYNTNWYNILNGSGYSYEILFEGTLLYFNIRKSSAFSNYTNNTPVTFDTVYMALGFDTP